MNGAYYRIQRIQHRHNISERDAKIVFEAIKDFYTDYGRGASATARWHIRRDGLDYFNQIYK